MTARRRSPAPARVLPKRYHSAGLAVTARGRAVVTLAAAGFAVAAGAVVSGPWWMPWVVASPAGVFGVLAQVVGVTR